MREYTNGKTLRLSAGPRTVEDGSVYVNANALKGGPVCLTLASRWDFVVAFLDADEAVRFAEDILAASNVYTLTDKGREAVR